MKKRRMLLWAVGLLAGLGALSLVSCARKESASSSAPSEFENAYSLYVTYVEESGGTPVSYEEWLATVMSAQGDKGDKGEQGDKSDAGVGVKSAYWTDEGELVLVLTDGTELNVGKIQPPAHTCTYGDWEDVIATCESHWQVRICNECGDSQMRSAELLAHSYINGVCEFCHTSVTDLYNNTYGYEYLGTMEKGAALQAFYKDIKKAVVAFHTDEEATAENNTVVELEYASMGLTKDEAIAVWKTFKNDNPLYYWLSNTLSYTVETATLLVEEEYASGSVRAAKNEALYGKIEEYLEMVKGETSAYKIALAYHDAIIENIDYAYDDSGKPSDEPWAHSIVGVLEEKGAVCEGYARTFQLLLNASGVESIYVSGEANGGDHVWNMVRLEDGKWYYCDLTWDDTPSWMWGVSYNYFCVAETQNVNWRDGNSSSGTIQTKHFTDAHTAETATGMGADFLYGLPAAAETPFSSLVISELRSTFTVDGNSYSVAGYNAVQFIDTEATGDVVIPDSVTYKGETFTVISVGGIYEDGRYSWYGSPVDEATTLFIPHTVRFLWDHSVRSKTMKYIEVDKDNPYFTSLDGVLFTKSLYTLILYPVANERTEYVIPDETVRIAYLAFRNNAVFEEYNLKLEKLTFGKGVSIVGVTNWGRGYLDAPPMGIFGGNIMSLEITEICKDMSGKQRIVIAEGNTSYYADEKAIYNYSKTMLYHVFDQDATTFEIPATLRNIDSSGLFQDMKNLESFTVEEGNENYFVRDGLLYNRYSDTYIVLEGVPMAAKGVVTIVEGTKSIPMDAFRWRKGVTEVILPSSITSIPIYAFADSGIRRITIPDSVTEIGDCAFYQCVELESVTLGSSVTEIKDWAFASCSSLKNIFIGSGVQTVGEEVFLHCFDLTVYCEAAAKPDGWDEYWDLLVPNTQYVSVVWGYEPETSV